MAYERKPGTGALFRNKSDNPKAPTHKGYFIAPDGTEFKLAGWLRDKQDGDKYLSFVHAKPPRDEAPQRSKPAPDFDDDLSSVPF